jgi:hypothetical protein
VNVDLDVNLNMNATLDVVVDRNRCFGRSMSWRRAFQKLRVYQRSIEFLALTMDVIATLSKACRRQCPRRR